MGMLASNSRFMTVVTILPMAVLVVSGNGETSCGVHEGCEYKVNCTVGARASCPGWVNETGNDNLDWVAKTSCRGNQEYPCLTIFFGNSPANSAARLESPWICATGTGDKVSTLSFRYAITGPPEKKNCPLSVYVKTKTNTRPIWISSRATRYVWMDTGNLIIQSAECPFQLVFEGKRIDNDSCGISDTYNYLSISDIVYEGVVPPPTTFPSTTSSATTAAGPSVLTSTDKSGTSQETGPLSEARCVVVDGVDVGVVAGVGAGALVVIACLIAVLIYVCRKRMPRDRTDFPMMSKGAGNDETVHTAVNHGHESDNDHGSLPGESSSVSKTKETYEGIEMRPGSNFYTTLATEIPAKHSSTSRIYENLMDRPAP